MYSTTSFCCSVPEMVFSILIPCAAQYSLNPQSMYSFLLFDLKYFTFKPISISTMAFHFLKVSICQIYFLENKLIPFYLSHQWKWCNNLNLQGMQPEKAPTNQCVLTLIFQPSVSCQFSKSSPFFYFPKMQLSHLSKSTDFNFGSFSFDSSIFIHFSLMWPSLQCHRLVSVLALATAIVPLGLEVIYRVPILFPRANTLAHFVTF